MAEIREFPDAPHLLLLTDAGSLKLSGWLQDHSGLPGSRANLTLAGALCDALEQAMPLPGAVVRQILAWADLPGDVAPENTPAVYLCFCGTLCLSLLLPDDGTPASTEGLRLLKQNMNSSRWRVREGAAMALQRVAERHGEAVFSLLPPYESATALELRAAAAALAHPPVLRAPDFARRALECLALILERVRQTPSEERRTEDFKTLCQGMQYALSVVVAALPEDGFALMTTWTDTPDRDILKILRSNLGKARLSKAFPSETAQLLSLLPPAKPRG